MEKVFKEEKEKEQPEDETSRTYLGTKVKKYTAHKTALFNLYAFTYEDSYQKLKKHIQSS